MSLPFSIHSFLIPDKWQHKWPYPRLDNFVLFIFLPV